MSSTEVSTTGSTDAAALSTIDMGLEVVTVPVADVERAKRFYQSLGWRLDADFAAGDDARLVQMTPPHSQCSIHFGKGITSMEPGSHEKLYLAVKDIDAAREDLLSRGIDVSDVEEQPKPPGLDLPGRSYFAYASFSDPDGNSWVLQEITTRFAGRIDSDATTYASATSLANAMRRASVAHGEHEKQTGEYDENWPDWYADHMVREQTGVKLPSQATTK